MNQHLQNILNTLQQEEGLAPEAREALLKSLKAAEKEMELIAFKLDRTEKVKRTTSILLEETIQELEQKRKVVEETNLALHQSLQDLKAAQAQLVQAEKMASLGELTAGIAHEIQNPLNFVNNFSEVCIELMDELKDEIENHNYADVKLLAEDVKNNLMKIVHHGKRADGIVKGMLQHSRTSSGVKEPVDINTLVDEYLRLAFHGLKAKDKSFNASLKTQYDESIAEVEVVPQDIGRVILNLITNAFYAVNEKAKGDKEGYEPAVKVSTRKLEGKVEITVSDNGNGIPEEVREKIFQPFFTTKPTGEGTGLGLSLSYDIISKGHGGEIQVLTKKGEGSEFIILLPLSKIPAL
jgi:two-component system NtrC family sensor kinase